MQSPAALMAVFSILFLAESRADEPPKTEPNLRTATFGNLESCMVGIPEFSGLKIAQITVDKPDIVLGFLSNGAVFYCHQELSGTRGTFWKGVYEVQ